MDNVNVIRKGFIAPDFTLPSTDGNMVSLKDCLSTDFAVSPEKIHRLNNLKNSLGLTFPVLSDERMAVCRQYYVIDTESRGPAVHFTVFVIDDESIVCYRFSESSASEFQIEDFKKNISAIL